MRMAARVDANHSEIVATFRKLGCSVLDLSRVGKGCPDLLIGLPWSRLNILVEVKDGTKSPSRRRLTKDEVNFFDEWKGQVALVESVDDVIDLIKLFKNCGE